jgi:UDP-glucose 4-epimerase
MDNMHSGSFQNLSEVGCEFLVYDSKQIGSSSFVPDVIFHLGMASASAYYNDRPQLMAEVVEGAIAVFRFAVEHHVKVVATSTSSVYYGLKPPHHESMAPRAAGLYTEGRIAMERLASLYHDRHGLDVVVLRPFSVYGTGGECKGKYANIVNRFILNTFGKDNPVMYDNGTSQRDFIDVDDVVEAFLKASKVDLPGFETFNVGTGTCWSISKVKAQIETLARQQVVTPRAPTPATYPIVTQADTKKARALLGFRATRRLPAGIIRLLGYYEGKGI